MKKILFILRKFFKDSKFRKAFIIRRFSFLMSDRKYLELLFPISTGYPLNLDNPQTYNEKLQWLKLYNKNPLYTTLVDKYAVKEWVANRIGKQYIIPTLGVWDNAKEIDFKALPDQFVLKTTHGGGGGYGVIVCKDKNKLNIAKTIGQLNKCLKHNLATNLKEWVYAGVPRRIIAEQYMEDAETGELRDYKFFCFNGLVRFLLLASERGSGDTKLDYYDEDFNHLDLKRGNHNISNINLDKPKCFDTMKSIASSLSEGIPHVRVDLYEVNGKVYFGEMTFFTSSGFKPFHPQKWDEVFGSWLTLPDKKIE